jgi:hypothetical protein
MADQSHTSVNPSPQTSDASSELVRLAEEDGARFCQIRPTGLWGVSDRDGMIIVPYVDGAMSKVEAARLYIEDKGLLMTGRC